MNFSELSCFQCSMRTFWHVRNLRVAVTETSRQCKSVLLESKVQIHVNAEVGLKRRCRQ